MTNLVDQCTGATVQCRCQVQTVVHHVTCGGLHVTNTVINSAGNLCSPEGVAQITRPHSTGIQHSNVTSVCAVTGTVVNANNNNPGCTPSVGRCIMYTTVVEDLSTSLNTPLSEAHGIRRKCLHFYTFCNKMLLPTLPELQINNTPRSPSSCHQTE